MKEQWLAIEYDRLHSPRKQLALPAIRSALQCLSSEPPPVAKQTECVIFAARDPERAA